MKYIIERVELQPINHFNIYHSLDFKLFKDALDILGEICLPVNGLVCGTSCVPCLFLVKTCPSVVLVLQLTFSFFRH